MNKEARKRKLFSIKTSYDKTNHALNNIHGCYSVNIPRRAFFALSLKQYLEYCYLALSRFNAEIDWMEQPNILSPGKDGKNTSQILDDLSHWRTLFEAGISVYIYARICLNLTRSLIDALEFNKMDKDLKNTLDKLRNNATLKKIPKLRNIFMHPDPSQQPSGSTKYEPPNKLLFLEVINITTMQTKFLELDPLNATQELFDYTYQLIILANKFWDKEHEYSLHTQLL